MGTVVANRINGFQGDPSVYTFRTTDPDAVAGAGIVYWKEVSAGEREMFARDPDSGGQIIQITSGSGLNVPAATFVALTDTPANYTGAALDILRVNAGATAVEFVSEGSDFLAQYALLAGRGTTQTLSGATDAFGNLILQATAHATPGPVLCYNAPGAEAWRTLGSGELVLGRATLILPGSVADFRKDQNDATLINAQNTTDGIFAGSGFRARQSTGGTEIEGSLIVHSPSFTPIRGFEADAVHVASLGAANGLIFLTEDDTPIKFKTDGVTDTTSSERAQINKTAFQPGADGRIALGQPGTGFADLALEDGAVIDLGNGNYTVTHSTGLLAFSGDAKISGNLIVEGATTTVDSETVLISDNHLFLNSGYVTDAAQTGGLVVNYDPDAATADTVADAFVAGVPATSNPTVTTTGSATFAQHDFVQISESTSNDGLFEVEDHTGTTLTIRGIGTVGTVEDFTQNDFTAEAGAGAITKVAISVMRAGTDGVWESASGSSTPLTFDGVVGLTATQTLTTKSIDLTDNTLTGTAAEFVTACSDDTFVYVSDNLSVFAATTSAQLAGIISDETGTGLLVFGTNATLVTPTIASFANAPHDHRDAAGGGLLAVADFGPFQLYSDQLENPNTADWAVNALAPSEADDNNDGITVRAFDTTTEEGVGFTLEIPAGVTNMIIRVRGRARTGPAGARTIALKLYNRGIPNDAAVQAWTSGTTMADIDLPITTEYFQYDEEIISLATLSLAAGELTQFELTRVDPAAGTELTTDYLLHEIQVEWT